MSSPVIVTTAEELERIVERAVERALEARERAPAANAAPEWLDAKGAAELLGVCSRTVGNLAKSGRLPARRVGRLLRFRRADVLALLTGDAA